MAWAAALNLVSASSSSSLRLSICCMAASWLRCSTRIVRCCLGMAESLVPVGATAGSSALGLDHEDALPAQGLAGVKRARRRRPVHVDMAAVDRAAGVLRDEPAPETVVAIRRDIYAAAQRDDPWVDRDRLVVVQRLRRPRPEAHAAQRDVPCAPAV